MEVSRTFTLEEFNLAVSALPPGKADCLSDVFHKCFKHAGLKVSKFLVAVFNATIADGEQTKAFKISRITLLQPFESQVINYSEFKVIVQ